MDLIKLKRNVVKAYVFLRTHNHIIPSDVLDFILKACIDKIKLLQKEKDNGIK